MSLMPFGIGHEGGQENTFAIELNVTPAAITKTKGAPAVPGGRPWIVADEAAYASLSRFSQTWSTRPQSLASWAVMK